MSLLTEDVVLRVMCEEWDRKVAVLAEEVLSLTSPVEDGGKDETVLSPELKVRHKKSGIRYTVDSVSPRSVVLRTPEDELIAVDGKVLEVEYELS
jgi:hypothetical protein